MLAKGKLLTNESSYTPFPELETAEKVINEIQNAASNPQTLNDVEMRATNKHTK